MAAEQLRVEKGFSLDGTLYGASDPRPGNASFVPPPPDEVTNLLADLELFIHEEQTALPPLVRVALAHVHFETIHPFLDGNGRTGRLLIAMLLETWKLLPEPLLYVSGYLKANQADRKKVLGASSSTLQTLRLFELLPTMPKLTVEKAQAELGVTFPTASSAIKALQQVGVLVETTDRSRGKSFVYQSYLDILLEG